MRNAEGGVDRRRLRDLMERDQRRFDEEHPRSRELFAKAKGSLLAGVPMSWMTMWPGGFPIFAREAAGARVVDVDGLEYLDLCLGDTGAMTGHSPPVVVEEVVRRAAAGITMMLPTEDSIWAGEELQRRFGLPSWQFSLTATDANRWSIRLAREITGRPKVLVFNYCYHGTVDETFATLGPDGSVVSREGNVGPPVPLDETTAVVEFNDLEGLERALARGDVACVLAEPALTNIGIVLPEPGFHDALRSLTRSAGTLLIIDETHCICAGPGGATKAWGLEPDILTIGKPIGSGIPVGAYGVTEEIARRMFEREGADYQDAGGVGGTLAGNALSLAAVRATLAHVLTDDAFDRMIALGERFEAGVNGVIAERALPWHVTRIGCRAEYLFQPTPPRTGGEAAARKDPELDAFVHLYLLNRGVLMTPFHNMALMSPVTTEADVDRHTEVFAAAAAELEG
ncbi:MAG TPA: aspartate aminotransferase family protein [Actinomycetota bacterium]|nr:aspartate aminotransferase family protein [Actinomycetota bacterium]